MDTASRSQSTNHRGRLRQNLNCGIGYIEDWTARHRMRAALQSDGKTRHARSAARQVWRAPPRAQLDDAHASTWRLCLELSTRSSRSCSRQAEAAITEAAVLHQRADRGAEVSRML